MIKTYKIKIPDRIIEFHSISGANYVGKRIWYKPWRKTWHVTVELFNIFSPPSTFDDGLIRICATPCETEEQAIAQTEQLVKLIRSEMAKQ